VRTWTPLAGPFHGFLITHSESISIADHLTVHETSKAAAAQRSAPTLQPDAGQRRPAYRPTVHYAYHPCDDAVLSLHELAGLAWRPQERKRLLRDEITSGRDELGVLLMGHAKGAYWYGSQLTIDQARALAPCNSATTLQVTATVLAGMAWTIMNPRRGVVEPEELPFQEMLALTRPYLGDVVGVYTDWTPLADRGRLFDEAIDRDDPWQFRNFRVD
jgi:homospermidine synthase